MQLHKRIANMSWNSKQSSGCKKKLLTRRDLQSNGENEGTAFEGLAFMVRTASNSHNDPSLELSITLKHISEFTVDE